LLLRVVVVVDMKAVVEQVAIVLRLLVNHLVVERQQNLL
jgi:hypothetical protein